MTKFKSGDRVRLNYNRAVRGIVHRMDSTSVYVTIDGTSHPVWFAAWNWERDLRHSDYIGSAAWLEQRAYAAAFARE